MDRNTPGQPSSHNGWTGQRQTASTCIVSAGHGTGTTSQGQGQNAQGSKDSQGGTSNRKDPSSLQCFRWCQGWGHMAWRMCLPSKDFKPAGGNQGNVAQPPPALAAKANSRPPAFPPWLQTKTDHTESDSKERMTRGHPCSFSQPWPHCSVSGMF